MPQLSITPAVSPQPSAGISQMPAPAASATEGVDGLESAPGLNFGAVLSKQLKGIAALLEQKEDAGRSLVALNESAESAANAGAAVLPVDLAVLAAVSAAEGRGGLEIAPGLDFGVVLSKQLKGVAALLEQKEDAGLSLAAIKESAESAPNTGAAVLPVDLSVLTASMLVPAPTVQAVGGAGISTEAGVGKLSMRRGGSEGSADSLNISTEAGAEKPLMQLPKAGEVRLAAEIAANGKNLPQAVFPEQRFADKLAALVEVPAGNADGALHSTDLSAAANPFATAAVFRNPESLPALPVAPRVGSAEWGGAVGEKIVWMANQSHQVAELHLNPPNLGPLEVRLTISNDQASALFVSPHSAVREAIETALPRLREMLADNGIMLGNVTVGSESFSQQQASDQGDGKKGSRDGLGAESIMARIAVPGRPSGLAREGLVDIFA